MSGGLKIACLLAGNLPLYFQETDRQSEIVERQAIDLWNAGFGVIAPHLNAPRSSDGLEIAAELEITFLVRVLERCADALFVMPDWEDDRRMWSYIAYANFLDKPVFDSLKQVHRWRDGKHYTGVQLRGVPDASALSINNFLRDVPIAFVAGKYYVGEKLGDRWIPDRNAIHENILTANQTAVRLWKMGIPAFTPHNNTHHFELKTRVGEPVYQAFDMRVIEELANGIVILPNWVRSGGAPKEVARAQELKKPVIHDYDEQSLINWRDSRGIIHTVNTVVLK